MQGENSVVLKARDGQEFYVDVEDLDIASVGIWRVQHRHGYIVRTGYDKERKKPVIIKLHREIMKKHGLLNRAPCVDHINRNKLDNRKSNLRMVSWRQNSLNRGRAARFTTGELGVVYKDDPIRRQKWVAWVGKTRKRFINEEDAIAWRRAEHEKVLRANDMTGGAQCVQ